MKIKIDPFKCYSFKVLGLRFTHKSQLLPKSIVNYYNKTYYPSANRTLLEKIPFYLQKGLNKLFPNYLIETPHQHRWRTNYSCYEYDIFEGFWQRVKERGIKDVKLTPEEIKSIDESPWGKTVEILRKAFDEGRLGKPEP